MRRLGQKELMTKMKEKITESSPFEASKILSILLLHLSFYSLDFIHVILSGECSIKSLSGCLSVI